MSPPHQSTSPRSDTTVGINDTVALGPPLPVPVLVVDDYHVIEAALPVHKAMTFLLDHLPPRLQLVVTRRADPLLALARLKQPHRERYPGRSTLRAQRVQTTASALSNSALSNSIAPTWAFALGLHVEAGLDRVRGHPKLTMKVRRTVLKVGYPRDVVEVVVRGQHCRVVRDGVAGDEDVHGACRTHESGSPQGADVQYPRLVRSASSGNPSEIRSR